MMLTDVYFKMTDWQFFWITSD